MPPVPHASQDRAVQGLAWAYRGLLGFVLLTLLTAVGLLAFVPLYNLPSPTLYQPGQLEQSLLLLSLLVFTVGLASGVLYAVGLAWLYGPRQALGPAHAASVVRTKRWLAMTLVLLGAEIVVPSITGPLLNFPGIGFEPPSWAWSASVVLAGLRAIAAGLTLYYAVQGLAEEDERVRLLVGMTLGVAGAILWSGLAAYASGVGGLTMGSLVPFLGGVVAGLGTSAISLGLFAAVYRDIGRGLRASLPRPA